MSTLTGPDHVGDALWQGLAQKVIDHVDTPRNVREALLIKSPRWWNCLRRARGHAARKASMDIIRAETVWHSPMNRLVSQ